MLSVSAGIYRVGFTIFTSAIICKTGVSLFSLVPVLNSNYGTAWEGNDRDTM